MPRRHKGNKTENVDVERNQPFEQTQDNFKPETDVRRMAGVLLNASSAREATVEVPIEMQTMRATSSRYADLMESEAASRSIPFNPLNDDSFASHTPLRNYGINNIVVLVLFLIGFTAIALLIVESYFPSPALKIGCTATLLGSFAIMSNYYSAFYKKRRNKNFACILLAISAVFYVSAILLFIF